MTAGTSLAIIDVGSNSVRLMIIKILEDGYPITIDEKKATPRLANHIDNMGYLTVEGFNLLSNILQMFKEVALAYNVDQIVATATASLRKTANRDRVLEELERKTGISLRILSGEEEARTGFAAISHSFDLQDGLTVDVGGGSTEIVAYKNGIIQHMHSFDFGAVSLLQMNMVEPKLFEWLLKKWHSYDWIKPSSTVIAMGGTARVLARAIQDQTQYPLQQVHGFTMDATTVETWLVNAITSHSSSHKIPHIPKDRQDIVIPGVSILLSLLRHTKCPTLTISGQGLRNGLLLEVLQSSPPKQPRALLAARSILSRTQSPSDISVKLSRRVDEIGSKIAQRLGWTPRDLLIAQAAALLRNSGRDINFYHADDHTFYRIIHSPLVGVTHQEWITMALVATFRSKKKTQHLWYPYSSILDRQWLVKAEQLGVLLQLAERLSPPNASAIERIGIEVTDQSLVIILSGTENFSPDIHIMEELERTVKKLWKLRLIIPGWTI